MSAAAIEWLEDRFKKVAAALDAVHRGECLTDAQREALREARVDRPAPPRPSVLAWSQGGSAWQWHPGQEPGPDDWREHP